jgi:hypothetical protein
MIKVEIIYDDHTIYLITKDEVQHFDARYSSDLPFSVIKAIEKALGYAPNPESDYEK